MSPVRSGLEVLATRQPRLLRGRRVGLLCHQASVTRDLTHAIGIIRALPGITLAALFAPEHGIAGTAQDLIHVGPARDHTTGLTVHSLYGRRLAPTPAMLRGLDALVIDLQDVGARYYTYAWTMVLAMQACARAKLPVVVLDRPNPLGGLALEGNMADPAFASFVGLHPLPTRHGLTLGERALYHNQVNGIACDLSVVPMQGWRRAMSWEDTGLPWVLPSPNMPTLETALVYPGGCLIEGTNLSEGRGTTRPFELVGAPFLDGAKLADALDRLELPGVAFRPAAFEPAFQKWKGQPCEGVQVHVTDARRVKPFATYLALIGEARRLAPRQFKWRQPPYEFETRKLPIDLLCGGDAIRRGLERGASVAQLERAWQPGLARFARDRRPYLLYA